MKRCSYVIPVLLSSLFLGGGLLIGQTVSTKAPSDAKSTAQPQAVTPESPVLSFGDHKIFVAEFQSMMLGLPPQQRRQFFGRGGQRAFAENLGRLLVFANAAEKENLDQRPDVAAQLALARAQVLAFAEQQAIVNRTFVSDEEIRKYYDNNKSRFVAVHLLHISIPLKSDASGAAENEQLRSELEKVREQALKGEDFLTLAKQYSKDSDAAKGGDLGYLGRGTLGEPIDGVVFGLKAGDVSQIIDTPGAISIFKVVDQKQQSLTEAKEAVTGILKNQMAQMAMGALLRENPITYNDEFFKNDNGVNSVTLPVTMEIRKNGQLVQPPVKSSVTIERKDK